MLRTTSSASLMKKQVSSPFIVVVVTFTLILIQAGFWVQSEWLGCKLRILDAESDFVGHKLMGSAQTQRQDDSI
ncbi:hypothetical protein [Varibaculum cambriense]